jgi:hypothetical protein
MSLPPITYYPVDEHLKLVHTVYHVFSPEAALELLMAPVSDLQYLPRPDDEDAAADLVWTPEIRAAWAEIAKKYGH